MDQDQHAPWKLLKAVIATADLPGLGPTPRSSRFLLSDLNQKLDRFLAAAASRDDSKQALRSAALLWHDYLDESHAISQQLHTADGSFLHGIMHRREPDYGNAKYWFQRVAKHACFPDLADRVIRLLETRGEQEWSRKLAPHNAWDPFAFVDACEGAADRPSSDQRVQTLMAIQEIEFDCLLAHLFAA